MPRRSHGYRPYHNATSLYGWGYNGSAGPGVGDNGISRPAELNWESYDQTAREAFWRYCFSDNVGTIQTPTYIMGEWSEATQFFGDVAFGGLGVGIDFPLYLGHEMENMVGTPIENRDGYNTLNDNLARLQSHVPLPVRLDDYDSSGVRIGRENWVKIQGGVADCLGIKTSGSTVRSSGHLYGWGLGEYNGGPAHHASMRYWSCVPEIIDSGSDRFFVDQLGVGGGNAAYYSDSASWIADETATNEDMSGDWTDIASMNRHRNVETIRHGNSWYAGIKNGKLYTWGYRPLGKGKSHQNLSYHKISRVYHVADPFFLSNKVAYPLENNASISGIQPTYTKVFGGNNSFAALDSDGMLYFVGQNNRFQRGGEFSGYVDLSVATAYYPTKLVTADGDTGFSWYDSNYFDMTVIQNGKIFYAQPTQNRYPLSDHASVFTELDDTTSAGHGWAGTSGWTQAYGLAVKESSVTSDGGAVVAINASGQIWLRTTGAVGDYELMTNPPLSIEENKWSMLSPTGVTFKKIILNPINRHNDAWQILGLTDKGEIYTTDNTYQQLFPYVDPEETGRGAPATPDGNTCPYVNGEMDVSSISDFLAYVNMVNYQIFPSGFFKIKPLTNGGTGVEWDQQKYQCNNKIGWPINHPTWEDNQEGFPAGGGDGTADPTNGTGNTYTWGLEYRTVDGNDTLRYIPVGDRENNGGSRYNWLSARYPPVLEYDGSHIDGTDDNPNVRNGLIEFGSSYLPHGDFTASVNYATTANLHMGKALATNEDGTIIAVSSPYYSSRRGKVVVYRLISGSWTKMGSDLHANLGVGGSSQATPLDYFGTMEGVSLSKHSADLGDDLNDLTIAIGCPGGVGRRGEVYIFKYSTTTSNWVIKGSLGVDHPMTGVSQSAVPGGPYGGNHSEPCFGVSLSLSSDGNALAVGAGYFDYTHVDEGAVYVYTWSGSAWVQKGSTIYSAISAGGLIGLGTYKCANFGWSVGISDDADTVAVGIPSDRWQTCSDSKRLGTVQLFQYNIPDYPNQWKWRSTLYSPWDIGGGYNSNVGSYTLFGMNIALSANGNALVVGEMFGSTSVGPESRSGRAHVFERKYDSASNWAVKDWSNRYPPVHLASPIDPNSSTKFGHDVAISRDGEYIVVGAPDTNPLQDRGAVHLFKRISYWGSEIVLEKTFSNSDYAELKSSNTRSLGDSVTISKDGKAIFGAATSLPPDPLTFGELATWARWMSWKYQPDTSKATFSFKHPRRDLSSDRDFLWDGQDIHNCTDGWEDLTVCRWSHSLFNKYWGIR